MTTRIRPLTMSCPRRIAFALLLASFVALAGVAMAQNSVPLINQPLVPDTKRPGAAPFTLTVNGTGFVSGAAVHWNGSSRVTTFVSASKLTAAILASDIAKAGAVLVTVVNPSPGGGTSNTVFFPITLPIDLVFGASAPGAGSGPISAVTGDFNGDGKLDLAVTNFTGNDVSVFLGNGNGTFQAPVNYSTGTNPGSGIAVADFNGDGKLDLAVANSGSNDVSILLGNGDGSFRAAVNYATGITPTWVAVGDFNRDGKLDLAIADQNCTNGGPPCGTGMISVLLGNGDGTFRSHVDYPTPSGAEGPNGIAIGDFNNDGKLDLAAATGAGGSGTEVAVLLGNGDGTFQAGVNYAANVNPASIATADFNKDGKLDLVVVNNIGSVSILLGNGDGTFRTHVDYPTDSFPWGYVGIADFNEDGNLDFAVANSGANTFSIFLGNGDGTFQPQVQIATGAGPRGAIVGDFNRDGRLDLAVPNVNDNTISILLQDGTVSLLPPNLKFGAQLVGSANTKSVTVTNVGSSALTITSIAINGTNASDFSQSNTCPSSLASKAHCTISVTFTPGQLGPRTASITLTDNDPGSPQSVPLSGFGVTSGANATLSPTSLTFATQLIGTSSPTQSVTLSNYGTLALSISSIAATGDFHETNTCGSRLAVLASCTISVTFKPTQKGSRTGTLSITDDAPGSPQTAALKGTGTIVELNPNSLSFGIHEVGTISSQSTTLTNIGSVALSIGGITIKGTDADEFSQTNTCATSVAPGASCSITVTFKPTEKGTDSADVSISDNGGGSPQNVPLAGGGCVIINGRCKLAPLTSPTVRSALASSRTGAVPTTRGSSKVGTRIVDLIDSTRNDPFLANGTKRELLLRLWYPASADQDCKPAGYTSAKVWAYFSELTSLPLPQVTTNSCLDARVANGAHPVVVFTHGYTGTFTDYTSLFEDLASRGYVVASVDHTYEATAVEFPDGRFVKSMMGSHLANTWHTDDQSLSFAVSVRLGDLKFVLNELERLNTSAGNPFAGKLDMAKVALAGHSLGGLTTWLGVQQDARFKAAVLLDPYLANPSFSPTATPVMVLDMGREHRSEDECQLWSDLLGPRFSVNLRGTEHLTPSDAVWLAKGAIKTGAMGSDKTMTAIRDYVAAFLDSNLWGKRSGALLTGSSADYPDAEVTTQTQSLCGEAQH